MKHTQFNLQESAISAALKNDWEKAARLNQDLLSLNDKDIDAHLRLGFAYLQLGKFTLAKKAYLKALKIMPANQIAKNNLANIKILEKKPAGKTDTLHKTDMTINPSLFLNIPGRTKVISLINIGQADVLASLKIGQKTVLKVKKRHVEVRTEEGEYIGAIPDDISKRLIFFMGAKSTYSSYIKEAARNGVDIFIKEEKLGRAVRKYPSFPKNLADNMKHITDASDEKTTDGETQEEEDTDNHEDPIDIEALAQEFDENADLYHHERVSDDDEEEEE